MWISGGDDDDTTAHTTVNKDRVFVMRSLIGGCWQLKCDVLVQIVMHFFSHNTIIHTKWIRSQYIFVSSFMFFFFFNLYENKLWIVTKYAAGTSQSSIFMTHFLSARRMRADIFDKGLWRKHRIWKKIKVFSFMLNYSIAFYMIEKSVKFKVAS